MLIDHVVFQGKVYAGIVVALPRPSRHLCTVDCRNRAVAIIPKAAYQDAQANTSIDGYTNIAVRIMEGKGPCRYPKTKGGAPSLGRE